MIKTQCAMAHQKENVAPKIHSEKALEAEGVNKVTNIKNIILFVQPGR